MPDSSGELVYSYVTKTVKGKMGFIGLRTVAAGVVILTFSAAVIICVEIALFIHNLRKGKVHHLTLLGRERNLYIAGEILTEINDSLPFGCHKDGGGMKPFLFPDLFSLLGNQGVGRSVKAPNWRFGQSSIDAS